MDTIEPWLSDTESEEETRDEILETIRKRRHIKDSSNPLELDDKFFVNYFRLSKPAFMDLLSEIDGKLKPGIRKSSIPNILKLCAALRFCAQGSYQLSVGNDFSVGMCQSTVSLVLKEVLSVIETHICPKWIHFSSDESEIRQTKMYFFEKFGFPGVIRCIDGTHIKIVTPKKEIQHAYYNRKGFHSINALIVSDEQMKIRFLNARFPGSSHDSFVFNMSSLKILLEERYQSVESNTWLLGDAGYPLKPYLMTPFRDPDQDSVESLFNKKHSDARKIVERTIGVLKNRFRCVLRARELHYSPEKATQITNVCRTSQYLYCVQSTS